MLEYTCCICGKKFYGFGNNPWPLIKDVDARCCDECNMLVIEARIDEAVRQELAKEAEDGNK